MESRCPECKGRLQKKGYNASGKQDYVCTNPQCNIKRTVSPLFVRESEETCTTTATEDSLVVEAKSRKQICTKEELAAYADIDLKDWKIEKLTVNQWDMGYRDKSGVAKTHPLYQIKAILSPAIDHTTLVREIIEELSKSAPKVKKHTQKQFTGRFAEVVISDVHFGKLPYGEDSWKRNVLDENEKAYRSVVEQSIDRLAYFKPDRIVLPIGNDFFQIDNFKGTTSNDTDVSHVCSYKDIYRQGVACIVNAITEYTKIAPVDVIMVPGNHDEETNFHLGCYLNAWFRNDENVTIDDRDVARKYYSKGDVLLGYSHGANKNDVKEKDLPLTMAVEAPEEWSKSKHREWHLSHLHHSKTLLCAGTDSTMGVKVRRISALSDDDSWHVKNGFIGEHKCGEVFVWDYNKGLDSHINIYPEIDG